MTAALDGTTALVTGASRNIGAAIALEMGMAGARVAVHYHSPSSAGNARDVVAAIEAAGGRAVALAADVGDQTDVHELVAAVERQLGPPTVLVNNAATSIASNVAWTEIVPAEWNRVVETNLASAFLCARAVYEHMRNAGGGAIVNVSSVRALLGRPGNAHYTASKAGLIGLTRTLAREVGADGIRVNALIVGAIKTPDEAAYGDEREIDAMLLELQALKRRGLPSDVATAAVFLASSAAGFVTGQSLVVDGGWVMQ
jgi:3-oxoacyl-[acyl-carrier protein] reductase